MIEQLQKAQVEWAQKQQEKIDFINKQLMLERKAEANFKELNNAMREYQEVFSHQLLPLPRKPVLSDFYTQAMNSIDLPQVYFQTPTNKQESKPQQNRSKEGGKRGEIDLLGSLSHEY